MTEQELETLISQWKNWELESFADFPKLCERWVNDPRTNQTPHVRIRRKILILRHIFEDAPTD